MQDEATDDRPPVAAEAPLPGCRLAVFWLHLERPTRDIIDELVDVHHLSRDGAQQP